MKVLILANFDLGLYKFRKELIEKLIVDKNEVYISLPNGELIASLEQLGCKFLETPVDRRGLNPIKDLKLIKTYKKQIKLYNPDLVITYTIKPNIYGGIVSRFYNVEYAVNITGLGTAFEKKSLLRSFVIGLYKIAIKKAKVVFFENSENRDVFLSSRICDKEKSVLLNGAGVNMETYKLLPYPNNNIFRFLFVGRIMKEKGIEELFDAMKILNSEKQVCLLDVVGPYEENYKNVIEEYSKEGWLIYHSFQPDVKPYIENCDCFVLPSYHEGMANTNLECASSGRPIITSNIPGCKEAVIDGVSGYLCEPRNLLSLVDAMKKIMSLNQNERSLMGIKGHELMKIKFDKNMVVEKTINSLK